MALRIFHSRSAAPVAPAEKPRFPGALPNGVLPVGSPQFRQLCAVTADGHAYYAQGYMFNDKLNDELQQLRGSGRVPAIVSRATVPLSQIPALYDPDSASGEPPRSSAVSESDAAERLSWALVEAARAGASDLKIYQRDTETNIRVKVAAREYDLGAPWTPEEGWIAMNFLFNHRDDGGQHVSMAAGQFQSFSVSAGGEFPLPRSVIKLRGQKGFHETDHGLGTHMVLRFFYDDQAATTGSLEDLGFDEEVYEALQRARERLSGCVIIGGATGDGKSTTLIRTMDKLYAEANGALAIVTVEDPVEYRAHGAGIIQIPVGSSGDAERRKANYRQALMHFVRSNPDVGCISEIRDADGAKEILQFVASGHASYTTIHAESAGEIVFRLIDMGVAPEELAKPGGIRLLMKQTLVPLLCPHCARPARADELPRQARHLAHHPIRRRHKEGCPHCTSDRGSLGATAWAGYQRLVAVGEVIEPNEQWFRNVVARDAFGALNHWLMPQAEGGLGGTPLGLKVARHVLQGRLDPFDAIAKGADFDHPSLKAARIVEAVQ